MNLFKYTIFKICVVSFIYLSTLLFLAPMVDHFFTSIDEDIDKKETNIQIFLEIMFQLIFLCFIWYYVGNILLYIIEHKLNINIKKPSRETIGIIVSVSLVGLQKNLLDKINYLTFKHPFRFTDFYIL